MNLLIVLGSYLAVSKKRRSIMSDYVEELLDDTFEYDDDCDDATEM